MEAPENLPGRAGKVQHPAEKKGKAPEHFAIDDLLDFSYDDECLGGGDEFVPVAAAPVKPSAVAAVRPPDSGSNSSGNGRHFSSDRRANDACLCDGLYVPPDEIAELEWLSNFVEDSFSGEDRQKQLLISGVKSSSSSSSSSSCSSSGQIPNQAAQISGKIRTKRTRPAPGSWSSRFLLITPGSPSDGEPAKKVLRVVKKEADEEGSRRCLHCDTDKTPQWRAGPMGPKTLCNACGVRFKSGRLVPEYRPAASPTFSLSEHSNSHRKVLELRRMKEQQQASCAGECH